MYILHLKTSKIATGETVNEWQEDAPTANHVSAWIEDILLSTADEGRDALHKLAIGETTETLFDVWEIHNLNVSLKIQRL
jgi:hypothetical protein